MGKFSDKHLGWAAIALAIISLSLVSYLKDQGPYLSANPQQALIRMAMLLSAITILFSVLSIKTWQGILGMLIILNAVILMFFTRF